MFPNTNQKYCQTRANAYAIHGTENINIEIPTNLVAKPSSEHTDPAELDPEALMHKGLGHS